jgi:hypothetical protein
MPSVDGSLAAWLKSDALYALTTPGGVAWPSDRAVDVQFTTPYDARADALAEGARSAAIFAGPNVKDRVLVKGRRRDLLFKCVQLSDPSGRLGYGEGPEMVVNGTFDVDASSWSPSGGATVAQVAQRGRVTASGATYADQLINGFVIGANYRVRANVYRGTSSVQSIFRVGQSVGGLTPIINIGAFADLFVDQIVTAAVASYHVGLWVNTSTASTYSEFDNVSVKRVGAPAFVIGVAENENNTTVLTVIRKIG